MLSKGYPRYLIVPSIFICFVWGYFLQYGYDFGGAAKDTQSPPPQQSLAQISQTDAPTCAELIRYSHQFPLYQRLSFEETSKNVALSGWEDEWIANGVYDREKRGPLGVVKVDVVVTWVNGSGPEFQNMKEYFQNESVLNVGSWFQGTTNRYRDWDELRYCFRSLSLYKDSSWLGKIHLLVTETEVPGDTTSAPVRQVPSWLQPGIGRPEVQIMTHRELFQYPQCLPTFNSKAIESQFPNLQNTSSEHILSMNDDMFLGELSSSDTFNQLFGTALSFFSDQWMQLVRPQGNYLKQPGETSPAIYTSWLLTERFRKQMWARPAHFPRSVDLNIMREAYQTFPQDAVTNGAQRFRHEGGQVSNWLLVYHYTVERHREALLWSYLMLRMDKDGDGYLELDERLAIKQEYDMARGGELQRSGPPMLSQVEAQLNNAGLESHHAFTPVWTSLDGPLHLRGFNPEECEENSGFEFCFGSAFLREESGQDPEFNSFALFDRISRDFPQCGNCLIHTLLRTSPLGLSPLLPTSRANRKKAIKAIHKYRYIVGDQDGIFSMITGPGSVNGLVKNIVKKYNPQSGRNSPGYLCMNDDVSTKNETLIEMTHENVHAFLEQLYPKKSEMEI